MNSIRWANDINHHHVNMTHEKMILKSHNLLSMVPPDRHIQLIIIYLKYNSSADMFYLCSSRILALNRVFFLMRRCICSLHSKFYFVSVPKICCTVYQQLSARMEAREGIIPGGHLVEDHLKYNKQD